MKKTLKQTLPFVYIIAGVLGTTASFALTYDKIQVLKDPSYHPLCSINPILSCGSVMKTQQASVLGVPNTIFGLVAFSVLITLGVILLTGSTLHRRVWQAINAGALAGFLFFIYLYFQAVFRIHAICPYCFVVWLIVPPTLWYTTLYNLREGNITLLKAKVRVWLQKHHGDILLAWYVIFFGILLHQFWYYWKTLT